MAHLGYSTDLSPPCNPQQCYTSVSDLRATQGCLIFVIHIAATGGMWGAVRSRGSFTLQLNIHSHAKYCH
ncbi:hypothetical protein FKM82_005107 [Ascaphus truei]